MNKSLKLLLLAPFFSPLEIVAHDSIPFFSGNYRDFSSTVQQQSLTPVLYFSANWCMPCQLMEESTFKDTALKKFCEGTFLFYKVDVDESAGQELKKKWNIKYLPTLMVLSSNGNEQDRVTGFLEVNKLMAYLQPYIKKEPVPKPQSTATVSLKKQEMPADRISRPALIPEETPETVLQPEPKVDYYVSPETESVIGPGSYISSKPSFTVQVGTYSNYENAVKEAGRIEQLTRSKVMMERSVATNGEIFKLTIGKFKDNEQAKEFLLQLKQFQIKGFTKPLDK